MIMMTVNRPYPIICVYSCLFTNFYLIFIVNNLLPEQLKSGNKKWTDLALDFLNDEPQQLLQNQNPQQSQQIQ